MAAPPLYVKICGVTRVEDALDAVEAGASALGLNFVPTSKRRVSETLARSIALAVKGRVELVGVVADLDARELGRLRDTIGLDYLQLHGDEPPGALEPLLPRAFKAVAVGDAADVERARGYAGERILVDAKVAGATGGTGTTFDWALVRGLARERALVLAGGLSPSNVAEAVRSVSPFGVDVASGVESSPGVKDAAKVRAFVAAARAGSRP